MKKVMFVLVALMFCVSVKVYAQSNVNDFATFNDYWTGTYGATPNINLTGDITFGPALGTAVSNLNMTIAGNNRIFDGVNTYSGLNLGSDISLTINGPIVFQNFSNSTAGGAMYIAWSTASFTSAIFSGNISDSNGGAIWAYDSTMNFGGSAIFSGNQSVGGHGGAIDANGSFITFIAGSNDDIFFLNNQADIYAGAIHATGETVMSFSGRNISFDNNRADLGTAGSFAGAVYVMSSSMSFNLGNNISFTNNYGNNGGGAMNLYVSQADFTAGNNISFVNNRAYTGEGGALAVWMSSAFFSAQSISFSGNKSATDGGALYISAGSLVNFNTLSSDLAILFEDNYAGSSLNDIYLGNGVLNYNAASGNIILTNGMKVDGDGSGIINKTGTGSFVLGGETIIKNAAFNITGGNVVLLDNANFTGTSMVLPGTTLDMQNDTVNTITVGVFSSTVNTKMDIWSNGDHDKVIAGMATVGGNLDIKARVGRYDNKAYEIILSTSLPNVLGLFTSTSTNAPLEFTFNNYASTNAVILIVDGVFKSTFSEIKMLSSNQRGMANVFDELSVADMITDDLADIITNAMDWDQDAQAALLSQASGFFLSNVIRNAAADNPNNEIYDKIRNHLIEDKTNGGVWTQVKGGVETFKENDNSLQDYKDSSWGLMAGYDRYIAEKGLMWGAFVRFVGNNISQGDSSASGNKKGIGAYGGYIQDEWELKAMLLGSFDNFNTERRIAILDRTAKGEAEAFTMNADIEGAWSVEVEDNMNVKPYLGFELQNVNYKGFKESGAGGLNLDVKGGNYVRSTMRLGTGIEYNMTEWRVYGKLEGKYLMSGKEPEIESVFEGTNVSFTSRGTEEGKVQLGLGLGGDIVIAEGWKLFANMNYYTAARYQNIYGHVGVRYMLGK
ncbi:MAG: autotransporter domain-containing protein [Endomicrobia bacterium]|nr:autotransporter domain-containing protein [Endomicrobiia bacterium]MCL2506480.1 autotransporter domain-containing protein [Endomicrobiia bacterium]